MPALDVPYDIIEGYLEEEITMQRATHVRCCGMMVFTVLQEYDTLLGNALSLCIPEGRPEQSLLWHTIGCCRERLLLSILDATSKAFGCSSFSSCRPGLSEPSTP